MRRTKKVYKKVTPTNTPQLKSYTSGIATEVAESVLKEQEEILQPEEFHCDKIKLPQIDYAGGTTNCKQSYNNAIKLPLVTSVRDIVSFNTRPENEVENIYVWARLIRDTSIVRLSDENLLTGRQWVESPFMVTDHRNKHLRVANMPIDRNLFGLQFDQTIKYYPCLELDENTGRITVVYIKAFNSNRERVLGEFSFSEQQTVRLYHDQKIVNQPVYNAFMNKDVDNTSPIMPKDFVKPTNELRLFDLEQTETNFHTAEPQKLELLVEGDINSPDKDAWSVNDDHESTKLYHIDHLSDSDREVIPISENQIKCESLVEVSVVVEQKESITEQLAEEVIAQETKTTDTKEEVVAEKSKNNQDVCVVVRGAKRKGKKLLSGMDIESIYE
jgi:hypothetical protein